MFASAPIDAPPPCCHSLDRNWSSILDWKRTIAPCRFLIALQTICVLHLANLHVNQVLTHSEWLFRCQNCLLRITKILFLWIKQLHCQQVAAWTKKALALDSPFCWDSIVAEPSVSQFLLSCASWLSSSYECREPPVSVCSHSPWSRHGLVCLSFSHLLRLSFPSPTMMKIKSILDTDQWSYSAVTRG